MATKKPKTPEQIYIEQCNMAQCNKRDRGPDCPFCKANCGYFIYEIPAFEDSAISVPVFCKVCTNSWAEIYFLQSIQLDTKESNEQINHN